MAFQNGLNRCPIVSEMAFLSGQVKVDKLGSILFLIRIQFIIEFISSQISPVGTRK